MNSGWDEFVAQGVHLHQGRQAGGIAKIIVVASFGKTRASGRFYRQDAGAFAPKPVQNIWQGEATEVAASAETADYDVRYFPGELHLQPGFLSDNGLVKEH